MGIYDDYDYHYFHDVPGAPLVKCPRCGSSYPMVQRARIDTWNLGHYGCTIETSPRRDCSWVDQGCTSCKDELRQRIAHETQRIEADFWKERKY